VIHGVLQDSGTHSSALQRLAPELGRYKAWVDSLPPHDALDSIYHHAEVLARFGAAAPQALRDTVLANLRALLSASLQIDGARYATPYAFVRALKAGGVKAAAAVASAAVRLLTVHGAKGLEASVVLLLDSDAAERKADTMSVLVDWPGAAALPRKFIFVASEARPPLCAQAALASEQAERAREELNALYVAMTRARSTLAISSVQAHKAAPGSWWRRLEGVAHALEPEALVLAPAAPAPARSGEFSLLELPPGPPASRMAGRPPAAQDESSPSSRIGQAMHRLLEWGKLDQPPLAPLAREFGLAAEQLEQALAMARRMRSGNAAWVWEASLLHWQGNEVELLHEGRSLRLDRLVQRKDTGHWWVLDYKSAARPQDQPSLQAQLRSYLQAASLGLAGQTVHAAFITGQGELVLLE
jgi:ATP-dependent helicase/nuclease subunit A